MSIVTKIVSVFAVFIAGIFAPLHKQTVVQTLPEKNVAEDRSLHPRDVNPLLLSPAKEKPSIPVSKTDDVSRKQRESAEKKVSVRVPVTPFFIPPAASGATSSVLAVVRKEKANTVPPISPTSAPPPAPAASASPAVIAEILLDEEALFSAVVKIECPTASGIGKYVGSGFSIAGERIITAAHLVKDAGSAACTVIFPHDRRPIYYLKGTVEDFSLVKKRHDEEGLDVAVIRLPVFASYDDARHIFTGGYPSISYPVCRNPAMLGDILLHFGYPSSFLDQNYLQKSQGEAVAYADFDSISDQTSSDGSRTFKSPVFNYTENQTTLHPYMVSRVGIFYGDSGGLAFNKTKQCILGPERGGSMGGSPGENFSVFPLLSWRKTEPIWNH